MASQGINIGSGAWWGDFTTLTRPAHVYSCTRWHWSVEIWTPLVKSSRLNINMLFLRKTRNITRPDFCPSCVYRRMYTWESGTLQWRTKQALLRSVVIFTWQINSIALGTWRLGYKAFDRTKSVTLAIKSDLVLCRHNRLIFYSHEFRNPYRFSVRKLKGLL